jgi:hypothetical protein
MSAERKSDLLVEVENFFWDLNKVRNHHGRWLRASGFAFEYCDTGSPNFMGDLDVFLLYRAISEMIACSLKVCYVNI